MNNFKPLPLFEEFLNQQKDQEGEKIFLRKEQLRGVQITKDTKFTGLGSALGPVKEKDWLPEGEYEIGECDSEFVRLTGLTTENKLYWISRYDFEEVKFDLVSPTVASGTDAISDARDVLNALAMSNARKEFGVDDAFNATQSANSKPVDQR